MSDKEFRHIGLPYLRFDRARDLKLDLYLPRSDHSAPLLVWIHGGAWMQGDKSDPSVLPMVDEGWALASIQYHFSHEALFPAQIHQCKAAIRWLRGQAGGFGFNAERIGVLGASAGSHLAALFGTSNGCRALEGNLGEHRDQSSSVQAVVDLFGPTDFNHLLEYPSDIDNAAADSPEGLLLGGPASEHPDRVALANPIEWISDQTCPFLILHGKQDRATPWQQSQILADALEGQGRRVEFRLLESAGHGGPDFHAEEQADAILNFCAEFLLD